MPDPSYQFQPLSEDHLDALRSCVGFCCELSADIGIEPEEGEDTPEIADHIIRWWHAQPEADRPDAETLENAIGAALGEYLRFAYRLKWAVLKDEQDEAIVLTTEEPEGALVVSPFDAIHDYLPDGAEGFVVDMVANLYESDEMKPLERAEDDEVESLFPDEDEAE